MLDEAQIKFLTNLSQEERLKVAKEAVINRTVGTKEINGKIAGEIWKFVDKLNSQENANALAEEAERLNKLYS